MSNDQPMAPAGQPLRTVRCGHCGRHISWVTFLGGFQRPIDPKPSRDGNILIDPEGRRGIELSDAQLVKAKMEKIPLRSLHFETCPKAGSARKDLRLQT